MYLGGKLCCLYVLVHVCEFLFSIYFYISFQKIVLLILFLLCLLSRSCYLQIKFKEFFKRKKIKRKKKQFFFGKQKKNEFVQNNGGKRAMKIEP